MEYSYDYIGYPEEAQVTPTYYASGLDDFPKLEREYGNDYIRIYSGMYSRTRGISDSDNVWSFGNNLSAVPSYAKQLKFWDTFTAYYVNNAYEKAHWRTEAHLLEDATWRFHGGIEVATTDADLDSSSRWGGSAVYSNYIEEKTPGVPSYYNINAAISHHTPVLVTLSSYSGSTVKITGMDNSLKSARDTYKKFIQSAPAYGDEWSGHSSSYQYYYYMPRYDPSREYFLAVSNVLVVSSKSLNEFRGYGQTINKEFDMSNVAATVFYGYAKID